MKKNLTISKLLMLVIMAFLPFSMIAQEGNNKKPVERYWYIQADGGLSIYHGDLANYNGGIWDDFNHFKTMALQPNWDAHFGIGYQFGKVIGLNLKGGYGTYAGHKHNQALVLNSAPDYTRYNLGLDQSNYIEGNLNLTFNLFNMFKYNPRRVINLVPHIGIGGIYYKAGAVNHLDGDDNAETPALAEAADKRDLSFTVPAGMEITFNVAPKFDIFLDYTYLFTGTDNLDQVAKIKTDEDKHIINDKDMYSQFNLGLRYKFNDPCDIEKMARESKKITYRVDPDPLKEGEDGNVCFDVIVTIPGEYFEKKAVMNLKPYLAYDGGQINIDPITFVGEKVKGEGDFRVNYKEGGEFTKHYCMPYQPEMANSELKGDPMFYVYDGTIYPNQDEIVKNTYFTRGATEHLANGVIHKKRTKTVTVYDTTYVDTYVTKCTYYFKKDKWNIKERKSLNKIADNEFNKLLDAGVTEFIIAGWASPEGEEDHNNGLSTNRYKEAEKQIKDLAKAKGKNITINGKSQGHGEDLDKFEELVKDSNIKDRDAILSNIDMNRNRRAAAIEDLCRTYEKQLDRGRDGDILPTIRRAEIMVIEPEMKLVPRTIEVPVED